SLNAAQSAGASILRTVSPSNALSRELGDGVRTPPIHVISEHSAVPCAPSGPAVRCSVSAGCKTRWAHRLQVYVPNSAVLERLLWWILTLGPSRKQRKNTSVRLGLTSPARTNTGRTTSPRRRSFEFLDWSIRLRNIRPARERRYRDRG